MYLNSIYIGLKVLPIWIHWAQSIYYLGTWTLRDTHPLTHPHARSIDKAQDLNLPTPTGVTPLVAASAYGQHDAVVFLLETARLF